MGVPTWAAGAVAGAVDDGAGGRLVAGALGFLAVLTLVVALPGLLVGAAVLDTGGGTSLGDGTGLPAGARPFLAVYEDAARAYGVSPFLLMATHEDETAFSTSTAPGVRDGVNTAGCCAGPMQFSITAGATPAQGGRGGLFARGAQRYTDRDGEKHSQSCVGHHSSCPSCLFSFHFPPRSRVPDDRARGRKTHRLGS